MEAPTFSRANRWKRRATQRSPFLFISLFFLLFSLLLFLTCKPVLGPLLPISRNYRSVQYHQFCKLRTLGERFLWYAPHSGFSNQLSEFKNAVLMSAVLNRTLIVPPVLDHHAVALGSCPKFRVLDPKELRFSVWNHLIQLLEERRYVSMTDVIDISSLLSASAVRVLDFREFVSMWCDIDIDFACSRGSKVQSSLFGNLRQCGSLLSGYSGNIDQCLQAVDQDCRTTVWTLDKDGEDGVLDSFQPDEQLKKKKKISFVRKRRNVYKTLGPGSSAESATVLAFGSVFTGPYKGSESYIDIHESPSDQRIQSLIEKIRFLPFDPEITNAGKEFSFKTIKSPFLCAQLRLLDGQFKNHWKATFQALQQKLETLKKKVPPPIHVFLMTDLPVANWTGNYLGDLATDSDSFKLFFLREENELIKTTAKKLVASKHCSPRSMPQILLYVEEAVCSCASLGFVGTAGSTIAESIETMRKNRVCLSSMPAL